MNVDITLEEARIVPDGFVGTCFVCRTTINTGHLASIVRTCTLDGEMINVVHTDCAEMNVGYGGTA